MTEVKIPADFPNDPSPAAVGGAQPKLATRVIDGTYVIGLTHEERVERYLMCADLVDQLSSYCRRKADEHPDWSKEALLNRMEKGIRNKQAVWNLGRSEVDWIVERVRAGEARVRMLLKE